MSARRGFTLIEVMSSIAIALFVVGIAYTAFQQCRKLIVRTQARLDMHYRSRFLFERLRADCTSATPNCAMFVQTTARSGSVPGSIALVFGRSVVDDDNWEWGRQSSGKVSTIRWAQWRWDGPAATLRSGFSSEVREYTLSSLAAPWRETIENKLDYRDNVFNVVPQPRRTLSTTAPWSTLDSNGWGSPHADDYGDGTDLQLQTRPAAQGIIDCALQVVLGDGQALTFDDSAATVQVFRGVYQDGRIDSTLATSEPAVRPRLVRLRYTMRDERTGLEQDFSFSFDLPALMPPPGP